MKSLSFNAKTTTPWVVNSFVSKLIRQPTLVHNPKSTHPKKSSLLLKDFVLLCFRLILLNRVERGIVNKTNK